MKEMMLLLIITAFGFGQVDWQREVIEYGDSHAYFTWNALALDGADVPHVAFHRQNMAYELVYASRIDTIWQKEIIESGPDFIYYAFSMVFGTNNIPHLCYYRRDEAVGKTYICHAWRDTAGWHRTAVDSCPNYYWFWYSYSSIALDTAGLPGIAYTDWNVEDSIHYVKYAHYNGTDWDTSIVEYDSIYANTQIFPTDFSPSLQYDTRNIPYVAFYQYNDYYDTIKVAQYNDTLARWIVRPAVNVPVTRPPVSLQLDSQDYPCIAHGWGAYVAFSWWDGASWHTESTGTTMGWAGIQVVLDLDSLDNPHITYLPDPTVGHVCYSYKRDNTWHNCGWIEPDVYMITCDVRIDFALDNNDRPHVLYPCEQNDRFLKYAHGTITGVEEIGTDTGSRISRLDVCPNPFREHTVIKIDMADQHISESAGGAPAYQQSKIHIYDVAGRSVKVFSLPTAYSLLTTVFWDGTDSNGQPLSNGIYFVRLNTGNQHETKKVVLLR